MMWLSTKLMEPTVTASHQPPCVHTVRKPLLTKEQTQHPQGVLLPSKDKSWLQLRPESPGLEALFKSSKKIHPLLRQSQQHSQYIWD